MGFGHIVRYSGGDRVPVILKVYVLGSSIFFLLSIIVYCVLYTFYVYCLQAKDMATAHLKII